MNEQVRFLGAVEDLRRLLADADAAALKIDWRTDHVSIASRAAVLRPLASNLIAQFAETISTIGNVGLDAGNHQAYERICYATQDAFEDEFFNGYEDQEERAKEASRERVAA